MKIWIKIWLMLVYCFTYLHIYAQTIPEVHIDGLNLGSFNTVVMFPGNIIAPSTPSLPTTVNGPAQVEFIGGNEVILKEGFEADMNGSGFFRAYILPPDIEVVFINPNQPLPTVGRYEKLELGIKLPSALNQDINNFLTDATATFLNPYDPDQISIEATFIQGSNQYKQYGFYYKEYAREATALVPFNSPEWTDVPDDYEWRIRFAPPNNGSWTCNINVFLYGSSTPALSVSGIQFNVAESGKSGFLSVANDDHHFTTSDGNSFVPIGQNIPWTDYMFKGDWVNYDPNNPWNGITNPNFFNRMYPTGYIDMTDFIQNLADNDGNFVRVVNWHKSYLFEWEELGVYGSNRDPSMDENFKRQKMAWELDKIFETAELNDIKLLYCLEFQGQWGFDYTDNGFPNPTPISYWGNPYRLTGTTNPQEIFTNATMIKAYKKKLRYFLARWGYSSGLGVFQLLSEFDGWSYDYTDANEKLGDHKNNSTLASNIYNWHQSIGSYIKTNTPHPILITSGFGPEATPSDAIGSFFYAPNIDVAIHNRYGNNRSENWEMNREAQNYINAFDKPFLYTETGLAMDPTNQQDADPNDTEGCDDVVFHNFIWAGSTMGCAGTSLPWWQHFDNNRRANFKSMATFFNSIDFNAHEFTHNKNWPNNPMLYCAKWELNKNTKLESYYVCAKDPNDNNRINRVFGWVHNLSHYWWNLSSYRNCGDRSGTIPQGSICDDDTYSSPNILTGPNNNLMEIHGLKVYGNYNIEWFSTSGNGGIISTNSDQANILGVAKYNLPGTEYDYAYKVFRAGSNFREYEDHHLVLETDTIHCEDDTIHIEDPGDPGLTYFWNFGNGSASNSASPTVIYNYPGSYTVTLITTDSLGNSDTLIQTIVKLECDSMEEQSMHTSPPNTSIENPSTIVSEGYQKYIKVIPNPNNGEFMVYISSPVNINPTIYVRDLYGKILYIQSISLQEGVTQIPISKPELASGIYFITVDGFDEPIKMIITK